MIMRLRRTLASLALAPLSLVATCQSNDPGSAGGSCVLQRVATLPLTHLHHKFLVPVTIDGKAAEFILDTGSSTGAALFESAAEALGLKQTWSGLKVHGLGGEASVYYSTVSSLELGDVLKWRALSVPTIQTASRPTAAGLLGNNYLESFDIEFDLDDNSFNLFSNQHCPGTVFYWKPDIRLSAAFRIDPTNHIKIPVTVNEQAVSATLDSGAETTAMTWGRANALGITSDTPGVRPSGKQSGIGKYPVESWVYLLPKVTIGDETLYNVPVQIYSVPPRTASHLGAVGDLILGADFFENNRVYIAYKEHKIYFSPYKYKLTEAAPAAR